jgi:exonuclease SbcD
MDAVSAAIFQGFDYTALGHLHAPQKVGEKVRYSGSPLKYSLSEEHQRKSVSLVELGAPGSPVQIREIPVPALHDVRRIAGRFDDLMNPIWHENKNFEDYVFAEISDEGVLYAMEKLRTLFPRLLGVSLPFREMEGEAVQIGAVRERMTMEQHFARFYQETAGEELPEEHRAVLRELIEALEEEKREVYQS